MARTPRSAAEKLAMRKKKSRALLLFNIIAFSVVVIGAVLLCIFVFFKVGNVTFTSDAGYDEADIRRVCGINEGDNLVLLETESREKALEHRFPYIESAKIVKHIPSTIEIEITPAETAFSVACDAGYLYVSASGKVPRWGTPTQGAGDRFTAVRGHDCGARGKSHEHKAQRNDHVRR